MGDMAEVFREMTRYKKEKRAKRLKAFDETAQLSLRNEGAILTQHTEYHYSFTLNGSRVDLWPSSARWRWKNKTYYGEITDLVGFIRKRRV